METDIQRQVEKQNKLYHRVITNYFVDQETDQQRFRNLVRQISGEDV